MEDTKSDWRRTLLAARAAIPEANRRVGSTAIADRVLGLDWFANARTVLGYVPLGSEVDCRALLDHARERLAAVFVPIVGSLPEDSRWLRWTATAASADLGLPIGQLERPIAVLVPGVGFDHSCTRLGRGGGFYDRALAQLRRLRAVHAIGLAFEQQIVSVLPSDAWDQRVDNVASERRLLSSDAAARVAVAETTA